MNDVMGRIYWAPDGGGAGDAGDIDDTVDTDDAGDSGDGKDKGKLDIAYFSQLSPDVRETLKERLAKYPKLNDLAQAVVSQEDRLSRAVIVPNAEKPDPEEVKAFRNAMGLPEKAEEYEIKIEDIEGGKEVAGLLKKTAFNMGLTKTQAKKFGDVVVKLASAGKTKQEQDQKKAAEQFEPLVLEKVGKDEEKKTEVLNLFKRFLIKRIGDTELIKSFTDAGLIYNPAFAVKAADIERNFNDEEFVGGGAQGGGTGKKGKGVFEGYSSDFQKQYGGQK